MIIRLLIIYILLCMPSFANEKFDYTFPLAGNSMANLQLQKSALKDIYALLSRKYPECNSFSVTDTKISARPASLAKKNGVYIRGNWREVWTVKACEENVSVPVNFYMHGRRNSYKILRFK